MIPVTDAEVSRSTPPPNGRGWLAGAAARAKLRPAVFVAHVAVTCALGLLVCLYALTPEPVRIEVDLFVSAGTNLELFLNDLTRIPMSQRLAPGERRRYVFEGISEDITLLRIDPTDEPGAAVDVYSIVVRGRDGVIARFGPQALAGWSSSALTTIAVDEAVLRLRSTTFDPILLTRMAIPVRKAGRWGMWLPMVNAPDILWRVAALSLILLLIAATFDPARRLHGPIAAAAVALTVVVIASVGRMPDAPRAADIAVSRATFMGLSMMPIVVASLVLLVGSVVIGTLAAVVSGRSSHPEGEEPAADSTGRVVIVCGVLIIVVVTGPGIDSFAAAIATGHFAPQWDGDNFVYWGYRIYKGDLPYRDFWYPYGGAFTLELPLPVGPAIRWLYSVVLFGTFFIAFGRWRGGGPAALATVLLLIGYRFDMFPSIERYLLSVNAVLAYVAIGPNSRSMTRAPFWIACATALFFDPPQLLYAGLPICLIMMTDTAWHWRRDPAWRDWLSRRVRADFVVPLAFAMVYGTVLLISGQIRGALGFYWRLGDAVAYGAWPEGLPTMSLIMKDQQQFFFVGLAAVLVAVGTYEWIVGERTQRYGPAVMGMGLIMFMVTQKTFMRWMGDQLLVTIFGGIVVLALGWPGKRRTIDYLAAGLILGAISATLVARPDAARKLAILSGSVNRALSDVQRLATGAEALSQANAARFAPDRFTSYPAERQAVERLRAHAGPGRDVRVFAVTDSPILYVLTGQPRVWMPNLYNASPVYEQVRMVRLLENEAPPYAVVNRDRLVFDGFQMAVRVPLVFAEVVDRYVPLESLGRVDLLRRRASTERPALSYWRETLGADVNVGRLASVSSFDRSGACQGPCADLLEVRVAGAGEGPIQVPLRVGDLSFSVTLTRVPDEHVYRVLLDRVWFWRVAQRSNLPRGLGESLPQSVHPQVRQVPINDAVLY